VRGLDEDAEVACTMQRSGKSVGLLARKAPAEVKR